MWEIIFETGDEGVSLSDSGCRRHSIRQEMQESLYQTADAGVTSSDSDCRRQYINQRFVYDAVDTLSH